MLLRRRHERLDDVHVALAAVGEQLRLQAVVAELDLDGGELNGEFSTDVLGELAVGASGEHDDLAHGAPQGSGPLLLFAD